MTNTIVQPTIVTQTSAPISALLNFAQQIIIIVEGKQTLTKVEIGQLAVDFGVVLSAVDTLIPNPIAKSIVAVISTSLEALGKAL